MSASRPLTFLVVGATGDLARRKLFPALFAAYARGRLPDNVRFVGTARTSLDDAGFRERIADELKCEEIDPATCTLRVGEFLRRCHYRRAEYASAADYAALAAWLRTVEPAPADRAIYLAVPPFVFGEAAHALAAAGLLPRGAGAPWTRLVVEKPFGRDRSSYDELQNSLRQVCDEAQTFRIDHYLGKEVVQNLLVLRFANRAFDALWGREHVSHVHIAWSERHGVGGRAGYFDRYGIVRDVMQNHLLQILSLVAMERPAAMEADAIQDAKVALLRAMRPLATADLLVGQYAAGNGRPGYREEQGVPDGSCSPTWAAAVMHVDTPRWQGVPFLMTAGKAMRRAATEVRLHFRAMPDGLFRAAVDVPRATDADNELIARVQPDERLALRIVSKLPGSGMRVGPTELDLRFRARFPDVRISDAYENLLLDVVRGDRSLFIRSDELEAAWDLFTPALHELDARRARPELYAFGGAAPASLDALAARHGIADARVIEADAGVDAARRHGL
jgi:glucose-6-phosphate 1-dehydrogenase